MKKLLFVALAAVGMTACVQNEELAVAGGNVAIAFDNAYVYNPTRNANPTTTTESLEAFDVWAYMDEVAGTVLTDEDVTKVGGKWGYENIQYWMPNHTYYFAALAPANSNNVTETLAGNPAAQLGLGEIAFTNVDGTEDLLYAKAKVTTGDLKSLTENGMDAVMLQFQHLLSKVRFTFKNGFTTDNMKVVVSNVEMTAPAAGTINLAVADYTEGWNLGADANGETVRTLYFGDVAELAATAAAATANERLTIPATGEYTYNVKFDVIVKSGDVVALTTTKEATISGYALEMGKAYNFTAVIDWNTLALPAIEFTAEVDEWEEGAEYPAAVGKSVTNETELAAAFAEGGEYALANNIALTQPLTVPVGKTVLLDLYSHTLSFENDVQGTALITNKGKLVLSNTVATRTATGKVTYAFVGQNDASYGKGNYTISNCGTLEVGAGVVVENTTAKMSHAYYAIDNNANNSPATLVLKEGSRVENKTSHAVRVIGAKKSVLESNGDIYGYSRAIWVHLPNSSATVAPEVLVNINGGSLNVTNPEDEYQMAIYSYSFGNSLENVAINVYDGATVNGYIALSGGSNKTTVETVNVYGGAFNTSKGWGAVFSYGDTALAKQSINITGGTFSEKPNAYTIAEGHSIIKDGDNWKVIEGEVTTVEEVKDVFTTGGTLELKTDLYIDMPVNQGSNTAFKIEAGVDVTLDLNGKKLVVTEDSGISFVFYPKAGSSLTIEGDGVIELENPGACLVYPAGNVTIESGTFIKKIPAGTPADEISAFFGGVKGVSPFGTVTVTINGGYFDGGYYDPNADFSKFEETADDIAKRGKSGDKNKTRVALKNNMQSFINKSDNGLMIYGGTFVGANPAWGDEGCMLPTTPQYLRPWSYYQGAFLEGQTFHEDGIVLPEGYAITESKSEDGRPVFTVTYNK